METIGTRVARLRADAGMNLRDAANLSGLSQSTWSQIESGEREPTLGEGVGLANALGCLTSTIIGHSDVADRLTTTTHMSDNSNPDLTGVLDYLTLLVEVDEGLRVAGDNRP